MAKTKNILFVSHDGNRAGAQIFIFNVCKFLKKQGYKIVILIKNDWGSMRQDFDNNFETHYLNRKKSKIKALFYKKSTLENLQKKHKFDLIYVNTIACVDLLPILKNTFEAPIISHIHELSYSIHQYGPTDWDNILEENADLIIGCSEGVSINISKINQKLKLKTQTVHSFIENEKILKNLKSKNNTKNSWPNDVFTVGACGNSDWRKSPDIFIQIAKKTITEDNSVHFVWIGMPADGDDFYKLKYDVIKLGLEKHIHWIEPTPDALNYINNLDVFLNCSREDPFPLVMLEAAICQKPLLGFRNTGGAEEFIDKNCGFLSDYLDIDQMAKNIIILKNDKEINKFFGENAKNKLLNTYSFEKSISKIVDKIETMIDDKKKFISEL